MAGPRPVAFPLRLALTVLLGASAAALAGCNRQPRFVPASADSTLAGPRDSLAEQVRALQGRWGTEGAGEEAARLTAQVLLQDLRARLAMEPRGSWEQRARALLDSLDVGAEFASAPCVLLVNLFSRADPSAGSWPWAYWCAGGTRGAPGYSREARVGAPTGAPTEGGSGSGSGVAAQEVEGEGMSLVSVVGRGLFGDPAAPPGPPGIAALFARRSGGGQQPLLMVWRAAGARLELAQTLGPDSLGGVGMGAFESPGDSVVLLTTRTWRPTPRFDECATCLHVFRLRRFRWGAEGFQRTEDQVIPSPYVAFVQLVQALTAGDRDGALRRVSDPGLVEAARRAGWGTVRGPWRAAPGSEESAHEMVFYRGSSEAWKVRFERRAEDWLVASFEPTTRVIE